MSKFHEDGIAPTCPADVDQMEWDEAIAWAECWSGADCEDEDWARAYLKKVLSPGNPPPRPFIDKLMEWCARE